MSTRLQCCVPFCGSSRGDRKGDPVAQYTHYICRTHWQVIPRDMRRAYRRKYRVWKQTGTDADHAVMWRLWSRCVRYAIENAVGL